MPKSFISQPGSTTSTNGTTCIEFDGDPKAVELGYFYPDGELLGDCFYEMYGCPLGAINGAYDWSDAYGGNHAMLRSMANGNFRIGCAVSDATNATPIVITTAQAHPFQTNDSCVVSGVLGNTAANGTFTITRVNSTQFSLNTSVGNGGYTSGGIVTGPVTVNISFGADDYPYTGQWAYSAVGVDVTTGWATMYYDGVPVGNVSFVGNRTASGLSGNIAYMGGSDHNNGNLRISQYRVFEGTDPRGRTSLNGNRGLDTFRPQMLFTSNWDGYDAQFLTDFYVANPITPDKSGGYPAGYTHAGVLRGTGNGVNEQPTMPGPAYVTDPTMPNPLSSEYVQPSGQTTYTPLTPPVGSLVYDSIQRKNSTYTFNGFGGMGSTEGGSLGALEWQQYNVVTGYSPFGILNEQFVLLKPDNPAFSRVAIAQTNLDIRVSRKAEGNSTWGAGISTGILFRYVDNTNYCFCCTTGLHGGNGTRSTQYLLLGQMVNGTATLWGDSGTACPAAWEVLRVTTKSSGVYAVYCDATSVTSGTNAQFASGTGAGITVQRDPTHDYVGTSGVGLRYRFRNFTVYANP